MNDNFENRENIILRSITAPIHSHLTLIAPTERTVPSEIIRKQSFEANYMIDEKNNSRKKSIIEEEDDVPLAQSSFLDNYDPK